MKHQRESIIKNYIEAYNTFDVEAMIKDLSDDFVFENIQNEESTMKLTGIGAFKQQAQQAKAYFSERNQSLKNIKHIADEIEIDIEYSATLAMDFPNGLKKGDSLNLSGKSIFEFNSINQIIRLTDIS